MLVGIDILESTSIGRMNLGEAEDVALVSYKVHIHTLICLFGADDGLHLFPLI